MFIIDNQSGDGMFAMENDRMLTEEGTVELRSQPPTWSRPEESRMGCNDRRGLQLCNF